MTDLKLDRLGRELGTAVEVRADGLSRADLARRYAAPDGGPSAEGFVRFCGDLFQLTLTPQQQEGARALATRRRVLIVGGNALGKDALAAAWALYEVYVLGSLVLLTAPSQRQVKEILMQREVGRCWRAAAGQLGGERFELAIRIPGREDGGLLAFTAVDPDHFQGHHAPRLFIAATEAQGIERPIWDAMRRCQPALLLATCNPTSTLSPVYSFAQSAAWTVLHWSALDHPNVVTGTVVVPGAVTRAEVEEIRATDGEGSRFWQESVLGVWVQEVEDGLVDPDDFARALDPQRARAAAATVVHLEPFERASAASLGVDVAGSGSDDSAAAAVVAVARAADADDLLLVWALYRYREVDPEANAARIAALARALVHQDRLAVEHVVCDASSLGAVLSPLKRLVPQRVRWSRPVETERGLDLRTYTPRVEGFMAAWAALAPGRFANLRTQAYVELGEALRQGRLLVGPGCDPALVEQLRQELLAHQVRQQPDGKWALTRKDEVRARIGRSPDLSDALTMALLPWLTRERAETPAGKRVVLAFR